MSPAVLEAIENFGASVKSLLADVDDQKAEERREHEALLEELVREHEKDLHFPRDRDCVICADGRVK